MEGSRLTNERERAAPYPSFVGSARYCQDVGGTETPRDVGVPFAPRIGLGSRILFSLCIKMIEVNSVDFLVCAIYWINNVVPVTQLKRQLSRLAEYNQVRSLSSHDNRRYKIRIRENKLRCHMRTSQRESA
jgi:hypothetical protein